MRLHHFPLLLVAGMVAVAGCHSQQETVADVEQTRATFTRLTPDVKIGVVSAVLEDKGLLAVGEVDVEQHFVGETFVLMTPLGKIIGAGHVVGKTDNALHLKYEVNEDGRTPRAGDIAVKPTM